MENSKKKLRLEDIKVESFVTDTVNNPDTIRGGTWYGDCWGSSRCTGGKFCSDHTACNREDCRIIGSQETC